MEWASWPVALGVSSALYIAFACAKILDALDRLNKQIENVRYFLGQSEERLQRVNDKLHSIECHTARAVKDAYENDEWLDRQPPF